MIKYINTRAWSTEEDVNSDKRKNDKLWQYINKITGRNISDRDMIHLANYLKNDLGYEFSFEVPWEGDKNVLDRPDLTTAMRNEILNVLKNKSGLEARINATAGPGVVAVIAPSSDKHVEYIDKTKDTPVSLANASSNKTSTATPVS